MISGKIDAGYDHVESFYFFFDNKNRLPNVSVYITYSLAAGLDGGRPGGRRNICGTFSLYCISIYASTKTPTATIFCFINSPTAVKTVCSGVQFCQMAVSGFNVVGSSTHSGCDSHTWSLTINYSMQRQTFSGKFFALKKILFPFSNFSSLKCIYIDPRF